MYIGIRGGTYGTLVATPKFNTVDTPNNARVGAGEA